MPEPTKISFVVEWWKYERNAIRRAEIKVSIFVRGGAIAVITTILTYPALVAASISGGHEIAVRCIISVCAGIAAFILVFGVEFLFKLLGAHAKMDKEQKQEIERLTQFNKKRAEMAVEGQARRVEAGQIKGGRPRHCEGNRQNIAGKTLNQ